LKFLTFSVVMSDNRRPYMFRSTNDNPEGVSIEMPGAQPGQIMVGVNHGSVPDGAIVAVDYGNGSCRVVHDSQQAAGAIGAAVVEGDGAVVISGDGVRYSAERPGVEISSSGGIFVSHNTSDIGVVKFDGKEFKLGNK
jgi:hypothetical protein